LNQTDADYDRQYILYMFALQKQSFSTSIAIGTDKPKKRLKWSVPFGIVAYVTTASSKECVMRIMPNHVPSAA
jgi:hypothetical protein